MSNKLKYLIIHCTATPPGMDVEKSDIERWHLVERGWSRLGYSELFKLNGKMVNLTPYNADDIVDYNEMTWGVKGLNGISRHIVYAGGVDEHGKPLDTRTDAQKQSLARYIKNTIEIHPDILIAGHYHFANKACPSFNVEAWLRSIGIPEKNIYKGRSQNSEFRNQNRIENIRMKDTIKINTGDKMEKKPFWKSKTLWTFFVLFVGSLLNATGVMSVGELSPDATWVATVLSVVGMILRAITGTGLNAQKE